MSVDIEEQYDKIYRYCYFKLKHRQMAEDITQQTFLRFLESGNYRDAGRPLAYLYTIARNLMVDEFRKIPAEELTEEISQKGFEEELVRNLSLAEAMEELDKAEQELLMLRYVNQVSFADLCRLYGKSRFALHRELSKITEKLERRLSDES